MQGRGFSYSTRQPWYVTQVPTLPDEEMLLDTATSEGPVWGLYRQLKMELCAVLRQLQEMRDGCRVLKEALAEAPELPMMKYLDDKIQEYMAVESAIDEGHRASSSAMGDELVQETTENITNVVQNGY